MYKSLQSQYPWYYGPGVTLGLGALVGLVLYAHLGLTALILTNYETAPKSPPPKVSSSLRQSPPLEGYPYPPSLKAQCNEVDAKTWNVSDKFGYVGYRSMLVTCVLDCMSSDMTPEEVIQCRTECVTKATTYTPPCVDCLVTFSGCALDTCPQCVADSSTCSCKVCVDLNCNPRLDYCMNVGPVNHPYYCPSPGIPPTAAPPPPPEDPPATFSNISTIYAAYRVGFVPSLKDLWGAKAYGIAVCLVILSGAWAYVEVVMMLLLWFVPMHPIYRDVTLRWMLRLGKLTLVDVYAVMILLAGMTMFKTINAQPLFIKTETRESIYAFLLSTLLKFAMEHIIMYLQEQLLDPESYRGWYLRWAQFPLVGGVNVVMPEKIEAVDFQVQVGSPLNTRLHQTGAMMLGPQISLLPVIPPIGGRPVAVQRPQVLIPRDVTVHTITCQAVNYRISWVGRVFYCFLAAFAIVLLVIGMSLDALRYETVGWPAEAEKIKSRNVKYVSIFMLGSDSHSEMAMHLHSEPRGQEFLIFIVYLLSIVIPLGSALVSAITMLVLTLGNVSDRAQRLLYHFVVLLYSTSSIEVLLLGIVVMMAGYDNIILHSLTPRAEPLCKIRQLVGPACFMVHGRFEVLGCLLTFFGTIILWLLQWIWGFVFQHLRYRSCEPRLFLSQRIFRLFRPFVYELPQDAADFDKVDNVDPVEPDANEMKLVPVSECSDHERDV